MAYFFKRRTYFFYFFCIFKKKFSFSEKITVLHKEFHSQILLKDYVFLTIFHRPWVLGCSAKRLFLSYVLPSTYMVPLGDWSPQKKFQHYRPINGFGMAI